VQRGLNSRGNRTLDRLAQAITDHRDGPWATTAVPRLSLVATDEVLPPSRLLYEPMVSFVAAGAKRTVAGSQSWSVGDMRP
jgi:hypothetical protein